MVAFLVLTQMVSHTFTCYETAGSGQGWYVRCSARGAELPQRVKGRRDGAVSAAWMAEAS